MTTAEFLHNKFNPKSDQIPPIRLRKFRRELLYPILAELGFTVGAEVGVAQAKNAVNICASIPGLKLHCVDPWEKYALNPRAHDNQEECHQWAIERLAPYDVEFHQAMSMDAVKKFKKHSLDFVYIDGHHSFDYIMQDLIEWSKIVRPGGIVAGHDYYRFRWAGVQNAVDSYTRAHQINEFFLTDEKEVTFFWARPDKEI